MQNSKLLLIVIAAILLQSCATHLGTMSSNANLSNNNFKIVDMAYGYSSTTHVLGMGGMGKDALVLEAKRNLYKNYPLSQGQVFANLSVDFKNEFCIFWMNTKVIISADVVDFNNPKAMLKNEFNIDSIEKINNAIGDVVLYYNEGFIFESRIIKLGKKKATIHFVNKKDQLKIKNVSVSNLFYSNYKNIKHANHKHSLNDAMVFNIDNSYSNEKDYLTGKIIGLNNSLVLVEYENNNGTKGFKVFP